MKRKIGQFCMLIFIFCFVLSCNNQQTNDSSKDEKVVKTNKDIPIYNFNELEPLLYTTADKITIVNFWAMWCGPCVKELPYLQEYATKNPEVELLLISLDFTKDIETKLKPFIQKNNITAKVILLDDPDSNTWINKISQNWSGAIPFTIIFNNKKRLFYERSFENLKDLESEININFKQ